MFIKIKGYPGYQKNRNILLDYLININQIRIVVKGSGCDTDNNLYVIHTDTNNVYTHDDIPALIEKRMATPYNKPFIEKEKQYRDPILPQDIGCLAEFSDDKQTWYEGKITSFSGHEDDSSWGARFTNGTAYYKYARIPV